ncbi:hypothetical protein GCM10009792_11740 [Microcella alkalica]|uniref:Uncharacterized protein n=1 Tax=Microcella alkalica TaxID=355930 RepID=A0A839E5V6_9MICO|nr:DUF6098 family protein [Microcella alkalica]MBA8847771.1 hypothetical protein [Microcella alkalica]
MSDTPRLSGLSDVVALVCERPDACVRYSRDPRSEAGRGSMDTESGLELPGLSVNPLGAEAWWSRPLQDWIARQLCQYRHLAEEDDDEEREAWVIAGREVGRGPDCEPLLADVEILAVVAEDALDEAEARYLDVFDAGRGPED